MNPSSKLSICTQELGNDLLNTVLALPVCEVINLGTLITLKRTSSIEGVRGTLSLVCPLAGSGTPVS